jgi:hypothetical protein
MQGTENRDPESNPEVSARVRDDIPETFTHSLLVPSFRSPMMPRPIFV